MQNRMLRLAAPGPNTTNSPATTRWVWTLQPPPVLGRLQAERTIESFEPVLLEPNGGELLGFVLARGDASKLAGSRASAEFQRLTARAGLIVSSLGVVGASIGQGLANLMATYQAQLQELA